MLEELIEANGYIKSKIQEKNQLILEMEKYAEEHNVPIISKEVAAYLQFIIRERKPKHVLEVGTAIGYSGIVMGMEMDRDATITTIEIDPVRMEIAKENFLKSKLKMEDIHLILGDAGEVIPKLNEETYDFVFIDAAKGQYKKFFDDSYARLEEGGMVFIDNIMFRGYLYKEYPSKFKTIVRKLDEFITYLYENHNFVLLPFGDGIGLVIKG
ncbi:MAG: O-methyltransferase, partial [Fusobacteriaceae bacterium]